MTRQMTQYPTCKEAKTLGPIFEFLMEWI